MRQALACGLFAISLCACEDFPQLDEMITQEAENADYPELLPPARLKTWESGEQPVELDHDNLTERAQRLHERGNALRDTAMADG